MPEEGLFGYQRQQVGSECRSGGSVQLGLPLRRLVLRGELRPSSNAATGGKPSDTMAPCWSDAGCFVIWSTAIAATNSNPGSPSMKVGN